MFEAGTGKYRPGLGLRHPEALLLIGIMLLWGVLFWSPSIQCAEIIYTVQIERLEDQSAAMRRYEAMRDALPDELYQQLRVERIDPNYLFRIGAFSSKNAATEVLERVREAFPNAVILRSYFVESRVVAGMSSKTSMPKPMEDAEANAEREKPAGVDPATETAVENEGRVEGATARQVQESPAPSRLRPTPQLEFPSGNTLLDTLGMDWQLLAGSGLLVIALLILLLVLIRGRRRARREQPSRRQVVVERPLDDFDLTMDEQSSSREAVKNQIDSEEPAQETRRGEGALRLTRKYEQMLNRNLREISNVEANILSSSKSSKKIYITSCNRDSNRDMASFQLAYGLSMNKNSKVVLVDSNPESPGLHRLFGSKSNIGLMDILSHKAAPNDVLQALDYNNLFFIPYGAQSEDDGHLLRSESFGKLLEKLSNTFDFVVFVGSSILGSSHASRLAEKFDGSIIVVDCESTKWEVLQMAKEKITHAGSKVLGVVLNKRKFYIPRFLYGRI